MSEAEQVNDQAEVIEQVEETNAEIVEESATSEETVDAVDTASEEPEKKDGIQKRIDELTRKRYEEAEARKAAEERARQLEAHMAELQAKQVQGDLESRKPRIEDYDYDQGRFEQAYSSWLGEVNQRNQQVQQEQEMYRAQQQAQIQRQVELERKIAEGSQKYPDFTSKVNDPNVPSLAQMNHAAFEAVMDSDMTADISYYLASNPSEVYRFQEMSPIRAVKEVAMLEAKLTAKPANVTAAPAPPSKVTGQAAVSKDPDKMTTSEWMAMRRSQLSN